MRKVVKPLDYLTVILKRNKIPKDIFLILAIFALGLVSILIEEAYYGLM